MYYFASDMHLGLDHGTSSRERERVLVQWLDEVAKDAEAIALVGDVFDFWFEWRRVVPKGFTRLLGKLSELTDRGVRVHFFTGNHDLWAQDYLEKECGVKVHTRPEVFEAYGKRVFVAHGDKLYLSGDRPLRVRVVQYFFYSRLWRALFSTLVHPDLAMRMGLAWSRRNRKSKAVAHRFAGEEEYLIRYAREYSKCLPVDYFVFGHLHSPVEHPLGNDRQVVVLGEWFDRPSYAVLTPDGKIKLHDFNYSGGR